MRPSGLESLRDGITVLANDGDVFPPGAGAKLWKGATD
jgi:hypothetical protein